MSGSDWMIYGANGYAGALMAEHAVALGHRPLLAGRRESAIRPLAEKWGLAYRVFALDDSPAVEAALAGVGTLLLAAGPFSSTSAPAIDACLRARANYVDITGEVAVFEAVHLRDAEAKRAGIVLLPGAGFDVVPSDCLARALHEALPGARRLSLAIAVAGAPGPGSIKTALEGAADGGWVRRGGRLERVPAAWRSEKIPFAMGPRWAMTIPWGDLSTAFWSTRIPDIEVFMATPWAAIQAVKLSRPIMPLLRLAAIQGALKRLVGAMVRGGDRAVRETGGSWVWGRAEDGSGRRVEGAVESMETTTLTAHTAVDITVRLQRGEVAAGYTTPSLAFGAGYIRTFPKTRMTVGDAA